MSEPPDNATESTHWPYADLPLKCPHCPWCGSPPVGLIASTIYPTFFCRNEECPALTWDPTLPAIELLRSVGELQERDSG